jgi:hypothetical protein
MHREEVIVDTAGRAADPEPENARRQSREQ